MKEQTTTIRINESTKRMLDRIKIHLRETYNDILVRIIKKYIEEQKGI